MVNYISIGCASVSNASDCVWMTFQSKWFLSSVLESISSLIVSSLAGALLDEPSCVCKSWLSKWGKRTGYTSCIWPCLVCDGGRAFLIRGEHMFQSLKIIHRKGHQLYNELWNVNSVTPYLNVVPFCQREYKWYLPHLKGLKQIIKECQSEPLKIHKSSSTFTVKMLIRMDTNVFRVMFVLFNWKWFSV